MKIEIETRKVELSPREVAELLSRMNEEDLRETFRLTNYLCNRIIVDELRRVVGLKWDKSGVNLPTQQNTNLLLVSAIDAIDHVGQANWSDRMSEDAQDILKRHSAEANWDSATQRGFLLDYIEEGIAGAQISLLKFDLFLARRRKVAKHR